MTDEERRLFLLVMAATVVGVFASGVMLVVALFITVAAL